MASIELTIARKACVRLCCREIKGMHDVYRKRYGTAEWCLSKRCDAQDDDDDDEANDGYARSVYARSYLVRIEARKEYIHISLYFCYTKFISLTRMAFVAQRIYVDVTFLFLGGRVSHSDGAVDDG